MNVHHGYSNDYAEYIVSSYYDGVVPVVYVDLGYLKDYKIMKCPGPVPPFYNNQYCGYGSKNANALNNGNAAMKKVVTYFEKDMGLVNSKLIKAPSRYFQNGDSAGTDLKRQDVVPAGTFCRHDWRLPILHGAQQSDQPEFLGRTCRRCRFQ